MNNAPLTGFNLRDMRQDVRDRLLRQREDMAETAPARQERPQIPKSPGEPYITLLNNVSGEKFPFQSGATGDVGTIPCNSEASTLQIPKSPGQKVTLRTTPLPAWGYIGETRGHGDAGIRGQGDAGR